jgi:hypothetical protein
MRLWGLLSPETQEIKVLRKLCGHILDAVDCEITSFLKAHPLSP